MLQSTLFTKTTKTVPHEEASLNAQLLIRAGFVDKVFAGVYTILPLGWRVMRKIENIIREEINAIGGQEMYMPALHPIDNYNTTGRADMDVLFHTQLKNESKLVLGSTHEEIITPMAQRFISSYKDLPVVLYQFQTKFRNETRAKSGIMRGREFLMKDLYSFHTDEEDLNEYYKSAQKAYFKIFERAGILNKTYLTFASGGAFSKYSHEFQTLSDAGEDIIHICEKCNLAINKEIIEEQPDCPSCGNIELIAKKAIETGNIFKLNTRFSHAFGLHYMDKDGAKKEVTMGCYGIGLSRLMGVIAEISNDTSGIIWPESVAPFAAHLLNLKMQNKEVSEKAHEAYGILTKSGIDVLYDDRADASAGEKFADADLIGCPYQVIVSEKSLKSGTLEVKNRATGEVEFLKTEEIGNKLQKS